MRPDLELPEWMSPPQGPPVPFGPHTREGVSPSSLGPRGRRLLTKMFGTEPDGGLVERVQRLTRRALAGTRPLARYRAAACNPDHPGKEGYELGTCRGCRCSILINESVRRSAPEDAIIAYLCGTCFDISRDVSSPQPPPTKAVY